MNLFDCSPFLDTSSLMTYIPSDNSNISKVTKNPKTSHKTKLPKGTNLSEYFPIVRSLDTPQHSQNLPPAPSPLPRSSQLPLANSPELKISTGRRPDAPRLLGWGVANAADAPSISNGAWLDSLPIDQSVLTLNLHQSLQSIHEEPESILYPNSDDLLAFEDLMSGSNYSVGSSVPSVSSSVTGSATSTISDTLPYLTTTKDDFANSSSLSSKSSLAKPGNDLVVISSLYSHLPATTIGEYLPATDSVDSKTLYPATPGYSSSIASSSVSSSPQPHKLPTVEPEDTRKPQQVTADSLSNRADRAKRVADPVTARLKKSESGKRYREKMEAIHDKIYGILPPEYRHDLDPSSKTNRKHSFKVRLLQRFYQYMEDMEGKATELKNEMNQVKVNTF